MSCGVSAGSLVLGRKLIASLLANGFLCTFPLLHNGGESPNSLNFTPLYNIFLQPRYVHVYPCTYVHVYPCMYMYVHVCKPHIIVCTITKNIYMSVFSTCIPVLLLITCIQCTHVHTWMHMTLCMYVMLCIAPFTHTTDACLHVSRQGSHLCCRETQLHYICTRMLGVPHTLVKIAICYCILCFGY